MPVSHSHIKLAGVCTQQIPAILNHLDCKAFIIISNAPRLQLEIGTEMDVLGLCKDQRDILRKRGITFSPYQPPSHLHQLMVAKLLGVLQTPGPVSLLSP